MCSLAESCDLLLKFPEGISCWPRGLPQQITKIPSSSTFTFNPVPGKGLRSGRKECFYWKMQPSLCPIGQTNKRLSVISCLLFVKWLDSGCFQHLSTLFLLVNNPLILAKLNVIPNIEHTNATVLPQLVTQLC